MVHLSIGNKIFNNFKVKSCPLKAEQNIYMSFSRTNYLYISIIDLLLSSHITRSLSPQIIIYFVIIALTCQLQCLEELKMYQCTTFVLPYCSKNLVGFLRHVHTAKYNEGRWNYYHIHIFTVHIYMFPVCYVCFYKIWMTSMKNENIVFIECSFHKIR